MIRCDRTDRVACRDAGDVARRCHRICGWRQSAACTALIAMSALAPGPSRAAAGLDGGGPRDAGSLDAGSRGFSLGILSGVTRLDGTLAQYRWDTSARGGWGAQLMAGAPRLAAGLRVWRTETTQDLGIAEVSGNPAVHATRWQVVGRGRVSARWGSAAHVTAGVGRIHLGYDPDRVEIPASGSAAPITVSLAPVDEWLASGGFALQRPLSARWTGTLDVEHEMFTLVTAHRNGDTIERRREAFGNWSARLGLWWQHGRH